MTRSVNALLREYAVTGVALLRLVVEQNVSVDTDIDHFCSLYEERLRRRVRDALEFRVDLKKAAHSSPTRLRRLLRTTQSERCRDRRARSPPYRRRSLLPVWS